MNLLCSPQLKHLNSYCILNVWPKYECRVTSDKHRSSYCCMKSTLSYRWYYHNLMELIFSPSPSSQFTNNMEKIRRVQHHQHHPIPTATPLLLLPLSSCHALDPSIAVMSLLLSRHPKQPLHLIVPLLLSASLLLWWGSAGQPRACH